MPMFLPVSYIHVLIDCFGTGNLHWESQTAVSWAFAQPMDPDMATGNPGLTECGIHRIWGMAFMFILISPARATLAASCLSDGHWCLQDPSARSMGWLGSRGGCVCRTIIMTPFPIPPACLNGDPSLLECWFVSILMGRTASGWMA